MNIKKYLRRIILAPIIASVISIICTAFVLIISLLILIPIMFCVIIFAQPLGYSSNQVMAHYGMLIQWSAPIVMFIIWVNALFCFLFRKNNALLNLTFWNLIKDKPTDKQYLNW
jgi:hypothetical protein